MRVVTVTMLALIFWHSGAQSQATTQQLNGEWATQAYSARVRFGSCGDDAEKLCGTIVWLWDAVDASGAPLLDVHNPQLALRRRPLIGLPLLQHFRFDASTSVPVHTSTPTSDSKPTWIEGSIYDPESGRTYRSKLTLRSPDTLEVRGCVLFVCRTQLWRRTTSLCSI